MRCLVHFKSKALTTVDAHKVLDPRVKDHVSVKGTLLSKSFGTQGTGVGALFCVYTPMDVQPIFRGKLFPADSAVWFSRVKSS